MTKFIYFQLARIPEVTKIDLSGKTIMVIGANAGIGFEATKHFATMSPARVILACRSLEKGKAAKDAIQQSTGCANLEVWQVDLSVYQSVVEFADKFEADGGRLDILVANAGVTSPKYDASSEGWEITFQVNHLSTSLLSLLLLPRMLDTARIHATTPRLVIVSSEVHYWTKIPKEILDAPNKTIMGQLNSKELRVDGITGRYFFSKLLNVLFTRALDEHLAPKAQPAPVIVDTVNPGLCSSEILRGVPWSFQQWALMKLIARTSEQGSRQLVYAALGDVGEENTMRGAYMSNLQDQEPSDFVISEDGKKAQERIWNETLDILSKAVPKVRTIANDYLSYSS